VAITALQTFVKWPDRTLGAVAGATSNANVQLSLGTDSVSQIVTAEQSMTISHVGMLFGNVTTGATVKVGLYLVDEATGLPARPGAVLSAGSEGDQVVAAGDDWTWFWTPLDTPVAVTAGDRFFIKVANNAGTPGNMQMVYDTSGVADYPYVLENLATRVGRLWAGFRNSDGTIVREWDCICGEDPTNTASPNTLDNWSSSTTPDHFGIRFQIPFGGTARCIGFEGYGEYDEEGDWYLVAEDWDGTPGNALATMAYHDFRRRDNGINWERNRFFEGGGVELATSTWYRLVFVPGSTIATEFWYKRAKEVHVWNAISQEGLFMATSAKDPTENADWTDYDNVTDGYRIPLMTLYFDGFDFAAAGGGGGGGGGCTASMGGGAIQAT
jgi:hypothetical protein